MTSTATTPIIHKQYFCNLPQMRLYEDAQRALGRKVSTRHTGNGVYEVTSEEVQP